MYKELTDLPGIGAKTAEKLKKLGIYTIEDMLYHYPFRYDNRSRVIPVRELLHDQKSLIRVQMDKSTLKRRYAKAKRIVEIKCFDDTGAVQVIWFNQPYMYDKISKLESSLLFGTVKDFNGKKHLVNPEIIDKNKETYNKGYTPVYKLTQGLTNNFLKKVTHDYFENHADSIEDIIPHYLIQKYKLIIRKNALKWMHFPPSEKHYQKAKITLAFEELLVLQLGLAALKAQKTSEKGIYFNYKNEIEKYLKLIPFELTTDQYRCLVDIKSDMNSTMPMNRLLQGDVGSGKTVTAFFSVFLSFCNHYQSAMMVPTEILARQHMKSFNEIFNNTGIRAELLLGSQKEKIKKDIKSRLESGEIDFVIGTHALIQESVKFFNLGLVITDEQHRFGVNQRAVLSGKGNRPDVLVMSATPIPRTLSLIVYGDLDISTIKELPPGRKKIDTFLLKRKKYDQMLRFVEKQIKSGRQIYFVAPSIFENDNAIESVEKVYAHLVDNLTYCRIGLVHGRQKNEEKESVFGQFLDGELDILVSTTVIEVGVNVPNASVIVIESAERFGLSQLHQLRGRVGRGSYQSYCFLVSDTNNETTLKRLETLTISNDGFFIANEDLKLRGPGEFLGTKQHGELDFKFINPLNYGKMIEIVKDEADRIIDENPNLRGEDFNALNNSISEFYKHKKIILN
ncbi:MAG: ATP-dependent DNA helicase RecG [Clostridiales bacterium 38_11]|nr:MAG: ATP-dependent DNA helicase RecG [Clostridiales bacterium 38_11]HBH12133.1 DNA helicase RecG [Clostridiales bacterium]